MIRPLRRSYAARAGVPVVDRVDTAIFHRTYFMSCMQCSYCFDSCCAYGVDVDEPTVKRMDAVAPELAAFTGVPREDWFTGEWTEDPEQPGGRHTRTKVKDGLCVFKSRAGRGCTIHSFALASGRDYHDLKPMVAILFPVTFDYGLLHPSNEIEDGSLQCYGDGPTLYQGVRDEIAYYFGEALVGELDAMERAGLAEEPRKPGESGGLAESASSK
ncbi:MAG TPA: hypothetical protein VGG39_08245 [Polyangiaceae bacterium]